MKKFKTPRQKRLLKIKEAEMSIADSLLQMRKCPDCNPTLEQDDSFKWLYYLIYLAKQSA
jgi:hypothetical protein